MASKITIKRSLTAAAPAGLSFGEMAFVQGSGLTANQLYVGISGGSPVWVGAQIGTTGTWTDNAAKTSLATQYATDQRIAAQISGSGVSSVNGITGAVVNVALTTNSLSQFAATTSSQLLGVISDETGTGSLVFATSPTLVTPALGTPSALVGTNITGTATAFTASNVTTNANLTGHITSTGNAAVLGSFTSSQLATALTDETGSGANVFATSPTFTTSVIGGATMAVFNTVSTNISGFGAATTMTLGATTGNAYVRNPTLNLGNTTSAIVTTSGTTNSLTLAPFGSLVLSPTSASLIGGDRTSLTITNPDSATGTVSIAGGDLYLGTKDDGITTTAVNIIFEGATDNGFETTLTVTDPTADRTITLPDATGTVALTANKLSVFAATTSSELLGVISDETGTGSLVFATSPTLVTPALGTPSALVGTNITGTATAFTASNVTTNANLTGHITSTGNAAVLGSFTSSQLATALTDETGSGAAVFANTPTLVTPNIGAATGTSLVLSGDLTVNGTTTTLNSTTLTIDDKNIELGSVAVPDNITAADGGITLKGTTDKTLKWLNSGAFAWTSSENFDLVSTKAYYIAGASVLNATTLGSAIVTSSLTSVGTLTSLTVSGTLEAGLIDGGTF